VAHSSYGTLAQSAPVQLATAPPPALREIAAADQAVHSADHGLHLDGGRRGRVLRRGGGRDKQRQGRC